MSEVATTSSVTVTIDGIETSVPKGTLIIRAAEQLGIQIPRFCDHPLLDPVGACRQCIVEIEGQRKPMTSCTTTVSDGMVIKTQLTSAVAEKAQAGTLELLLINHPLDCPICDKGGECPLQNQAMTNGYPTSRYRDEKRTYPKPIAISQQVLLDRERCVLCARCTRFSQQIAGDPFIELFERGALEQVAISPEQPFQSYFSGNTVQICPVGALTGSSYRFRARPFDLVSTPSICEHCASGCAQRTDWRRGRVLRRLAGDDPEVNEEWNCDKGRWAFTYALGADRLSQPMVRDDDGYLQPASWSEALRAAADGLTQARGRTGVLTGGRLTVEDAYAYAKFARVALATNDVDFRARPHSAEEADFLASHVAGRFLDVTYDDLEKASAVLLVDFEPEEESPIVFLRLRKAALAKTLGVYAVAPFTTSGLRKCSGTLVAAAPGTEPEVLDALRRSDDALDAAGRRAADALRGDAIILVGERAATTPGTLSAVSRLAGETGARLAWIPRRAGDRGAVEAGALPALLPGARPVADPAARAEVASVWGSEPPAVPGRDGDGIVAALRAGELDAAVVGGVDLDDLPDPAAAFDGLAEVPFIVSLELRVSAVTERADVVLPVGPTLEKAGSFVDWEGRVRSFDATLEDTGAMLDLRVLHALADEMGVDLGLPHVPAARAELARLAPYAGPRPASPEVAAYRPVSPPAGQAVLATWTELLDAGRMQDGEDNLAGTAKTARGLLSAATAAEIGAEAGDQLVVSTERRSVRVPLAIADLPDRVVWLPTNARGCAVRRSLAAASGALVSIAVGSRTSPDGAGSGPLLAAGLAGDKGDG
jgi:NADH-quinone oxidoreductase subunit G